LAWSRTNVRSDTPNRAASFVVACRLTGNFPGSPVDLRFIFELEGDKIVSLEITP
jgi:hypothetical protein